MNQFASRHPILFGIAVTLIAAAGITLLETILARLPMAAIARRLLVETAFCGYVIALLSRLKGWRAAGFKRPVSARALAAGLPLLALPLLVLAASGFKAASLGQAVLFAVFTLMVGFAEEGLLRGLVLHALLPIGPGGAVVLSAFLFGLAHLINIAQGAAPTGTLVQIAYAFLLGISFGGARLYFGSIWPVILVHALIDYIDLASRGFDLTPLPPATLAGAIVTITLTGLYALYGWWLLRHSAPDLYNPIKANL